MLQNIGNSYFYEKAIVPGQTYTISFPTSSPATLAVHVTAGSVLVEMTISTPDTIKAGTAIWYKAGMGVNGVLTTSQIIDINTPLSAVRITADESGAGVAQLMQGE